MIYITLYIILLLLLIISGLTIIQYYKKNKNLIKTHIIEKENWILEHKEKNQSIDNYLKSLKKRYQKEYDSLNMNYSDSLNKNIKTYNHIILEDEYENGDLKVSLDYVEYLTIPSNEKIFIKWIRENWISLITSSNAHKINWLVSKDKLKKSRKERIERIFDFIKEEEEKLDNQDNKLKI